MAPANSGAWIAVMALVTLIAQGTAITLVIRLSKIAGGTPYNSAVLIALGELAKCFISLVRRGIQ